MLKNMKVGDRVRSCLAGWGTVTKSDLPCARPVRVIFDCGVASEFFLDGRNLAEHIHPEIVEVAKQEWEPEGGEFIIEGTGSIMDLGTSDCPYQPEGRAYSTEELAQKAYSMIRSYQRLVAYVLEHAPDYEPNWEDHLEEKWYVKYDNWAKKYVAEYNEIFQHLYQVYMPKEVAIDLAEKLNSGEVEL